MGGEAGKYICISPSLKLIKVCRVLGTKLLVEHMLKARLSHLAQSQVFPPTAVLRYLTVEKLYSLGIGGTNGEILLK